uniref:TTF-type domain-containing protein n=1 Tax=Latimeria chalumnae TaxID=7897 RepID=H3A3P6_LATCH
LVKRGPKQITDIEFPQNNDKVPRRFTKKNYYIQLKNGDKVLRSWLVYSQYSDKVFCFCCVLFGKHENSISKDGFNTWECLSSALKDHEHSLTHERNMELWWELKARISGNKTIDSVNMELLAIEKNYWSKGIQNELISEMGRHIIQAIVEKLHRAKYFGVIMDSTSATSHTEQLSITLHIVNSGASIGEHFVGFLAIEATTSEALCNTLFGHLENLKIDINDCR